MAKKKAVAKKSWRDSLPPGSVETITLNGPAKKAAKTRKGPTVKLTFDSEESADKFKNIVGNLLHLTTLSEVQHELQTCVDWISQIIDENGGDVRVSQLEFN